MNRQKIWEELRRREKANRNYKDGCLRPVCGTCDPGTRAGCTKVFSDLVEIKELIRAKCPGDRKVCNYPSFRVYCPAWRSEADCS